MKRLLFILAIPFCLALFTGGQTQAAVGAFDGICHGKIDADPETGTPEIASTLDTPVCADRTGDNPITGSGGIIFKAINLIAFLTGAASIIIIVIGGIKYVLSAGDPGKVSSAKDTILYAVIGLVVSISARGIILFIVNRVN